LASANSFGYYTKTHTHATKKKEVKNKEGKNCSRKVHVFRSKKKRTDI